MTGTEGKTAVFSTFNGLRTDCPASKVDAQYSPDCADMIFTSGGMETRHPFRIVNVLPTAIVGRWEFLSRDGNLRTLFLCTDGTLYAQSGMQLTYVDNVAAGSECKAVVAYGRLYMAFFAADGSGGTDAPRCWDGINLYRVSQGGPGAAPSVTCITLDGVALTGNPLLTRTGSVVSGKSLDEHKLQEGFKVAITGVDDQVYPITSIQTDSDNFPGEAEITFAANPGFVPGDTLSISDVPYVDVGGGVQGYNITNGIASVTMNTAHNLTVGLQVVVSLHTYAPRNVTVSAILSATVWTYETEEPNVTDTGGYVHVPWPGGDNVDYTVAEVPTPTTVRIAFAASDYTWTGGNVTFPWNGAFFVDTVPTPTTFTYQQSGPDATSSGVSGLATPQGQIAPGEHQCCVMYITETGAFTPPSPPVRFIAKVNQYPVVTLPIGPANIKARIVAFTGVNGDDFAVLEIPARVGGVPVSTATIVKDNTSTSALFDFSDTAILSAERIDEAGFNLFQNFPLTTPDGVEWYSDRMFWKGNLNVELGIYNMAFDGGTLSGSTDPLGWTIGSPGGAVVQTDFMPAYQIAGGQSGQITQQVFRNYDGVQLVKEKTRYRMRIWTDAAHAGSVVATLSSALTGFSTSAAVVLSLRGYVQADFDADTPAAIPKDITLTISGASADTVKIRDMQLVYRDNPIMFPSALASYVREPDNYDGDTGPNGPNDDASGLSAMFLMQENFYGITKAGRLYYVQPYPNAEPSTWNWQGISDNCDAFHANAVTTGKGFAAWGGAKGAFWFGGGMPNRASAIIDPTWEKITGVTGVLNDPLSKRVYFGSTPPMVYDYRELELGGSGKWTPWNTPANRFSISSQFGVLFSSGVKTYRIDPVAGVSDEDFGLIGGYYTFASAGPGLFQKSFNYLWMRMSGTGGITPFLYKKSLQTVTATLSAQILQNDPDAAIEYPMNVTQARMLYVKIGLSGTAFSCDEVQLSYTLDPNSPNSGTRR